MTPSRTKLPTFLKTLKIETPSFSEM